MKFTLSTRCLPRGVKMLRDVKMPRGVKIPRGLEMVTGKEKEGHNISENKFTIIILLLV